MPEVRERQTPTLFKDALCNGGGEKPISGDHVGSRPQHRQNHNDQRGYKTECCQDSFLEDVGYSFAMYQNVREYSKPFERPISVIGNKAEKTQAAANE